MVHSILCWWQLKFFKNTKCADMLHSILSCFFNKKKCVDMVHVILVSGATPECAMLYVGRLINMEQISTHCEAHTCQHRVQTLLDDTATTIMFTFMLPPLEHVHTLVTHITHPPTSRPEQAC